MESVALLARYPFLRAASALVAEQGPSLEALLADPAYARARAAGRDRIVGAVRDGSLPPEVQLMDTEGSAWVSLLSYGIARMIASAVDDAYVTRRHALAEAVRLKSAFEHEEPRVLEEVALELGVPVSFEEDHRAETPEAHFRLHFTDFLRYAVILKDPTWKLVNQSFAAPGFVRLPQARLARLLQEAYRTRSEAELPLPVDESFPTLLPQEIAAVKEAARVKKEEFATEEFGELDLESLPPCMKAILGQLQSGVNAAHSARFAITSFLHAVGLESEDIMKLFAAAPDFREDVTRYQVEHITGKTSGTEYTPPGCQAMKTFGICYNPDRRCQATRADGSLYVTHPLSYYRWALKDRNRARGPVLPGASGDGPGMTARKGK